MSNPLLSPLESTSTPPNAHSRKRRAGKILGQSCLAMLACLPLVLLAVSNSNAGTGGAGGSGWFSRGKQSTADKSNSSTVQSSVTHSSITPRGKSSSVPSSVGKEIGENKGNLVSGRKGRIINVVGFSTPTPTPTTNACSPYTHQGWDAFGSIAWTAVDGEYQPSIVGTATEVLVGPGDTQQAPGRTYVLEFQKYFVASNGVAMIFVRYRADAQCPGPGVTATWVSQSHVRYVTTPNPTPTPNPTATPTPTLAPTATPTPPTPTPTATPDFCSVYSHDSWTAGTVIWDTNNQPSASDATELLKATGSPDVSEARSYEEIENYDAPDENGVLTRYVTYRAYSKCSDDMTDLTSSHELPEPEPGHGYGSASLRVLKKKVSTVVPTPTPDPKRPTDSYEAAKNPVKGQIYVALEISSSGVHQSKATVRLHDDKAGTPATESHIDVPVNLSVATGWQKFYDPDKNDPGGNGPKFEDWWPAPEGPQGQQGRYRYLIPWTTNNGPWTAQRITFAPTQNDPDPDGVMVAGKLWNRNGNHTVSLSSVNDKDSQQFTYGSASPAKSVSVADTNLTIKNSVWDDLPVITGGEIKNSGSSAGSGLPTTLYVQAGTELDCVSFNASDKDKVWMDVDGDGVEDTDEVQLSDDTLTYSWSAASGVFSTTTEANVRWTAPNTLGDVTLTCVIDDMVRETTDEEYARDDAPLTRTVTVKVIPVYVLEWDEGQTPVAIGAKPTTSHRATFTLTIKDGNGDPVPNFTVAGMEVFKGGRGANDTLTSGVATCAYQNGVSVTDSLGQLKGVFTSGKRQETTTIGIPNVAADKTSGAIASLDIDQVWSELSDEDSWEFDPYFDFDEESPLVFKMAFNRSEETPIESHNIGFKTTMLSGFVWDPNSGPDVNNDGIADGDYIFKDFESSDAGFDAPVATGSLIKRSDLVIWDPLSVTSSTGHYETNQTIEWNPDFIIDWLSFDAVDHDAFDSDGE